MHSAPCEKYRPTSHSKSRLCLKDYANTRTRSKNAQSRGPPLGVRTLRVYGPNEAVLVHPWMALSIR